MNATTSKPDAKLLSARAASAEFGIPRATLTKLLADGVLRRVRLPRVRRVWVAREDLELLIANSKEAA